MQQFSSIAYTPQISFQGKSNKASKQSYLERYGNEKNISASSLQDYSDAMTSYSRAGIMLYQKTGFLPSKELKTELQDKAENAKLNAVKIQSEAKYEYNNALEKLDEAKDIAKKAKKEIQKALKEKSKSIHTSYPYEDYSYTVREGKTEKGAYFKLDDNNEIRLQHIWIRDIKNDNYTSRIGFKNGEISSYSPDSTINRDVFPSEMYYKNEYYFQNGQPTRVEKNTTHVLHGESPYCLTEKTYGFNDGKLVKYVANNDDSNLCDQYDEMYVFDDNGLSQYKEGGMESKDEEYGRSVIPAKIEFLSNGKTQYTLNITQKAGEAEKHDYKWKTRD